MSPSGTGVARFLAIFSVVFMGVAANLGLGAEKPAWAGGYSSKDGGLARTVRKKHRIYSMRRLERLRRAVSPRYVRVLDWQHYGRTGGSVQKGILFTYADYRAKRVFVSGNFNNWQLLPLKRNKKGVHYVVLPIREIEGGVRFNQLTQVYRYKFLVDNIWTHDPKNKTRVNDGLGAYLSEYRPRGEDVQRNISVRVIKEARARRERLVEFAIYLPGARNLSLVGTFNNWNPEHDLPVRGPDGIFRLRLRLKPGEYVYKYIADGRWILDKYNAHTRYFQKIGELCSYIRIK